MKNAEDLKDLLSKYNEGRCSDEEASLLEAWYAQLDISTQGLTDQQYEELARLRPVVVRDKAVRIRLAGLAAAALLCACLSFLGWRWYQQYVIPAPVAAKLIKVAPGGAKATLKLSSGQEYALGADNAGNIKIDDQVIVRQDSLGTLSFEDHGAYPKQGKTPVVNTISTPYGGQFRVILSDGTRVWLNANSSVTFPASFSADQRLVSITGEAYFEVAKQSIPFKVLSGNQEVEVLGTHFSISAYDEDKTIKTTLLEGAVKVKSRHGILLLKPGQQCLMSANGAKIQEVDADTEVAWKTGDFVFNAVPITEMMKDLARWYHIEVNYAKYKDQGDTFTGIISRKKDLSHILQMLEKTNSLRFSLKGRTLYLINQ
ncbi:FecR family protein [Sphingobacterium thalpophilum]|uniref:FecR family protein n=1 Tax=Sphingobacterium thalpophilum TaxID=259 RepID=UPI003C76C9F2